MRSFSAHTTRAILYFARHKMKRLAAAGTAAHRRIGPTFRRPLNDLVHLECGIIGLTAAAAVCCAAALLLTSPMLPMSWDEGDSILRAEKIPDVWTYTTQKEGHPAFYGIVIACGHLVSSAWLDPLTAWRFGPIILFAAAAGAMFYRMARDWSVAAAVGSVACLMLLPRLFAHAHFASNDGPLMSCWILAWAAFPNANRAGKIKPAILWGILLGATFSCKATGWLAAVPFIVWAVLYRDRRAIKAVAVGLPIALMVFFLLNPPLWEDPIRGWLTFFNLNLRRADTPGLNISTQFFGRMYNLDYPLPWYNTLVWVGITVPVGILSLTVLGLADAAKTIIHAAQYDLFSRRRHGSASPHEADVPSAAKHFRSPREQYGNKAAALLAMNWLILLIVRALPGTPPHDAERLILPSFAFLAALSGIGCRRLLLWAGGVKSKRLVAAAALALVGLTGTGNLAWYAPQWLSYYNLLIGGLPGACELGMEPTYYWDGLDRSVLDWLNDNTGPDEKIYFAAAPEDNLELLRRWKALRGATDSESPGKFRWYVLQRRPSAMGAADLWLIEHFEPSLRKSIRGGGLGIWRLDEPLVEVYSFRQAVEAAQAVQTDPD
jgi:hypothetical protein